MEQDVRLAGDTADIETGQLLIIKLSLCPITFCNYKCLNISLFQNSAFFYTSIYYQSQSIHKQPIITVDTTPYSIKRCLCPIVFCNYKCLNIGLLPNSTVYTHLYVVNRSKFLHADVDPLIQHSYVVALMGLHEISSFRVW
jgi:hypothetical protein